MKQQTTPKAGSYAASTYDQDDAELARLKLQATIALEWEVAAWKEAGLAPGMHVLDLGCGPGFTSCELARFVGPEGSVTGLDLNPSLLKIAERAKQSECASNVTFQPGNLYQIDLPDDSFDFVYARFVFQHLANPDLALRNVLRVLKPRGTFCVLDIDDNWTSFFPQTRAFVRFIRKAGKAQLRKGGDRMIGSRLQGLLQEADFQKVHTRIVPLTTTDLGIQVFLGVAVLFRMELLGTFQRILAYPLLRKIKTAAKSPHAWGAVAIFFATGRKAGKT